MINVLDYLKSFIGWHSRCAHIPRRISSARNAPEMVDIKFVSVCVWVCMCYIRNEPIATTGIKRIKNWMKQRKQMYPQVKQNSMQTRKNQNEKINNEQREIKHFTILNGIGQYVGCFFFLCVFYRFSCLSLPLFPGLFFYSFFSISDLR